MVNLKGNSTAGGMPIVNQMRLLSFFAVFWMASHNAAVSGTVAALSAPKKTMLVLFGDRLSIPAERMMEQGLTAALSSVDGSDLEVFTEYLGHPTPNVDRMAKEGAMFTCWYGQASCTAGRPSFLTGRIPIRSALSVVVAPGNENRLKKETPTIAEFFQKNGYTTYFSGKWHMGDQPDADPIEHGFDEMKHFAAYYPGVYTYQRHHCLVPSVVPFVQSGIRGGVFQNREHVRMERRSRSARDEGRRILLGLSGHL